MRRARSRSESWASCSMRPAGSCSSMPSITGGLNGAPAGRFLDVSGWVGVLLGAAAPTLGKTTFDIYLNNRAYWRNVPASIWSYKLGGYQVLKKWLSYREQKVLGRALLPEEVQHFTDTARRIAAILLVTVR